MARNEEKAQSMLYRFREAQAAELGLVRKKERRPAMASSVDTVGECERWRRQILGEVSRKVSKIQDASLSDYQVRDLNDEINKLLREKYHWEKRIKQLGGGNYYRAPKTIDSEGKEVPGNRGYKYFGRARDLPGVRELFEMEEPEKVSRSRTELYRNIDADYYGYRDEEDGDLLSYEEELERERLEEAAQKPEPEKEVQGEEEEEEQANTMEVDGSYALDAPIPNRKQIEEYLVNRRRQELLDKYVSDDLAKSEQETKELTGQN
ncbi:Isy1-like splicing factor [Zychaea mexicana]|uniref:Isy1-like splicing factor n=1 Tax=Zychaea mexicana TaxID=64656 RepID=UPI0022FEADAF|nr:Isy1-like splicing factor [Zychaea mexicana]KAI9489411.1 Isy1-like splicing factor [Zychaea mexicana]